MMKEVSDLLATLHLTDIEREIIKPAVEQVIADCEDYLLIDPENEETLATRKKYQKIKTWIA